MKTEKLNLNLVKNALSREEMKKIMAGSGSLCIKCCPSGQPNSSQCSDPVWVNGTDYVSCPQGGPYYC